MIVTSLLVAMGIIGGIGLFIGLFLGIASIIFRVDVDEREEAVQNALPGNNCGGCGYPGCSGLAGAITKGEAKVNACPVGGAAAGARIAEIMGVEAEAPAALTAFVHCRGDCEKAGLDYQYYGHEDCSMQVFMPGGGAKSCDYGCMGFGNCVRVCRFDGIHIINGIAVVDKEICKACGQCVAACPKKLIALIPQASKHVVACRSRDKGPVTTKACSVGCIGCGICKKKCPADAITMEECHAVIDSDKCIGCGSCKKKCPRKSIV